MLKIVPLITFVMTLSIWTEAAFKDFVIEQETNFDIDDHGSNDEDPSNAIIERDSIDNGGLLTLNELIQGSLDSNTLIKMLKHYIENMYGIETMTDTIGDNSDDWQNVLPDCSDNNDLYAHEPGSWNDIFF